MVSPCTQAYQIHQSATLERHAGSPASVLEKAASEAPVTDIPHALYRHYDSAGVLQYVGTSTDPARRLSEHIKCDRWVIASVEVVWFDDVHSATMAEAKAVLDERPLHNKNAPPKKAPSPARTLADALGRSVLSEALALKKTAISKAVVSGKLPPAWFDVIEELADEAGIDCPRSAFSFYERANGGAAA